jgi:hypothetical protein
MDPEIVPLYCAEYETNVTLSLNLRYVDGLVVPVPVTDGQLLPTIVNLINGLAVSEY